jgi:hypothetical protein
MTDLSHFRDRAAREAAPTVDGSEHCKFSGAVPVALIELRIYNRTIFIG